MSHSLINPTSAPSVDTSGNAISYDDGMLHVDATPVYLAAIILLSMGILAVFKWSGFRFVIGVGQ